ncbi:hypothetical protein SERLA73DRAFT_181226 [Serpula lacrymans var. lacrymans S7.3]|uniref:CRAL-TRIO domain-containing protein n=2 Tax=Serpula lacrymans var. lacrymans TaxID=341189 RepID=F8PXP6_SERL3|nr:uncharacterized protein SERLADRAFT_467278 [Serpula lacrymans var. lacrymans S7.9]EGN98659.1 hypothetical protein SERLA73DRAFT_181226 [Serpula lacrymans var. lacrymans S7.3]EGO24263.1 hypothetical protein SERLADRAFT_467278 [Serpula lacrymans var. lacrymans S7.9]
MSESQIFEPIPVPVLPDPKPLPELSANEAMMYEKVYQHFVQDGYVVPELENGELLEEEKMWLSYECILRYLRATKWDVNEAIKRLEGTLKWRREYGLYDTVTPDLVEPEAVTGKEFIFGYDTAGRPATYMIPSRQNTEESPRQIQYTVWMLERAIDLMGPGVETLALMINYADKAKNTSLSTARTVLNILQTHYPERLGLALILNTPWMLYAFYKVVTPFIDPITRQKMRFNPKAVADGIFVPEMLVKQWWGGAMDFEYEHGKYWKGLVGMCDERRRELLEKWREMGAAIGLKEWDVKRAVEASTSVNNVEESIIVDDEKMSPVEGIPGNGIAI